MPVRIKILAGSQSSHQRGFRFLSDFDRVIGSPVQCDDPGTGDTAYGGCPGGGVRVVPGELPGEDERIKKW